MLRLWCSPTAAAPIRPLAWEPPCATGAALKRQKTPIFIKPEQSLEHRNRRVWGQKQEGEQIACRMNFAEGGFMGEDLDETEVLKTKKIFK